MKLFLGINSIVFLLCISSIFAQTPPNASLQRAQKHINDAQNHYATMDYIKAKESYQFAARIYRKHNAAVDYAKCYNGIGNIYIELNQYEAARNSGFEQALALLSGLPTDLVDSTVIADAYEGIGRYYASASTRINSITKIHYQIALEWHQKALAIRQRKYSNLHPSIASSYYYMGQCYRGLSTHQNQAINTPIEEEIELLHKALAIQQKTLPKIHYQTANTYEALGDFYYDVQQDYHKGFQYHEQAFLIRKQIFPDNHIQIATSYTNLAIYYRVLNLFDKELVYLEKALQIQLNYLGEKHTDIAQSYYHLAQRYQRAQQHDKALIYYQKAAEILIVLDLENSMEMGEIQLALALWYRAKNYTELELKYLQKSEQTLKAALGDKHFKLGFLWLEYSQYYIAQKDYTRALFYSKITIRHWKNLLTEQHYLIANAYEKIASIYQLTNHPQKELAYLKQALDFKTQEAQYNNPASPNWIEKKATSYDTNRKTTQYQLYLSHLQLGAYYQRQEQYSEGLQHTQRALANVCNSLTKQTINIYSNPNLDELSRNIEWLKAIQQKAQLLLLRYQKQQKLKDLNAAVSTYQLAIQAIKQLRINFTLDDSRQKLVMHAIPIYQQAITALFKQYQYSKDRKAIDKAFDIAEQSRSFVLLHELQNTLARGNTDIPPTLLDQEQKLRQELAYYSNFQHQNRPNNTAFEQNYLAAHRAYDSLIAVLETSYPSYYNLKYQNKVVSLSDFQEQLGEDEMTVAYFFGEQTLYAFIITAESKQWLPIPLKEDYQSLINDFRATLTNYKMIKKSPQWAYQSFLNSAYQFYEQFFASIEQKQPFKPTQLTIIPDGKLSLIPFDVLLREQPSKALLKQKHNYQNLPFLIKDYPINYHYSATLFNNHQFNPENNGQCIGFAPSSRKVNQVDSLPWTQQELKAIEQFFDGHYYYGNAATKAAFTNKASDFSIIHLAMHGIVNLNDPMQSLLSFSQISDSLQATNLLAYEIHNLSLNTDLVVLSACETGIGKAAQGDGVFSLARAFLYAGASSVVTTLWEVNDFTSAALISTFYYNLSQGMSKPIALQQAKLTFLEHAEGTSGHPTYWSSFISIGNPKPVRSEPWLLSTLIAIGCFLGLLGLVWWFKKKKSFQTLGLK